MAQHTTPRPQRTARHDHSPVLEVVSKDDVLRLEGLLNLALELLCPTCRPAAVARLHPAPAPIPGVDDAPETPQA